MFVLVLSCAHPDDPPDSGSATTTVTARPLAGDVGVVSVEVLQGTTARWLPAGDVEPPLIAGRDARVDVGIVRAGGSRPLVAELVWSGPSGEHVAEVPLTDAPTVTFEVPGEWIEGPASSVAVRIVEADGTGGDPRVATWSALDVPALVLPPLEVVLVPVRYDADGSGRLPDTSEPVQQRFRDVLLGMYPVPDVIVRVAEPFPWSEPVGVDADGGWASWTALLIQLLVLRAGAEEPANMYYFGLVDPADSFAAFCLPPGCVVGASFVTPVATVPGLRAAVGLGLEEAEPALIAAHELGHAHGRDHAPCGGPDPATVDAAFPYADAAIGRWGWDLVSGARLDPVEHRDVMSYCAPEWVSDYTWSAWAQWTAEVADSARAARAPRQSWVVGADGARRPGPTLDVPAGLGPTFVPFSEGSGGLLLP